MGVVRAGASSPVRGDTMRDRNRCAALPGLSVRVFDEYPGLTPPG